MQVMKRAFHYLQGNIAYGNMLLDRFPWLDAVYVAFPWTSGMQHGADQTTQISGY